MSGRPFPPLFRKGPNSAASPTYKISMDFSAPLGGRSFCSSGFAFSSCPGFLKDFQPKEMTRLIQREKRGQAPSPNEEAKQDTDSWWLAHILFLNSPALEEAAETAAQISPSRWTPLIQNMLSSYQRSYPHISGSVFQRAFQAARKAHGLHAEAALCSHFFFDEDPRQYIQNQAQALPFAQKPIGSGGKSMVSHYNPRWLMGLLQDLSWGLNAPLFQKPQNERLFCSYILPLEKRNTLLYAISRRLLSDVSAQTAAAEEKIPKIWAAAEEIMALSIKMNQLKRSNIWKLAFKALLVFASWDMDGYSFYINFSAQILRHLLAASNEDKALALEILQSQVWPGNPPDTAYHKAYRNWMKELLAEDGYPWPPGGKIFMPLP